jgi:hypothetical protein
LLLKPVFRKSGITSPLSIGQATQARNPFKRCIQGNNRLSVVAAESRDPIVILAQTPACPPHFPVQVSRRFGYSIVEAIDGPPFKVFPCGIRREEGWRDLGQADNGGPDTLCPMSGQEGLGGTGNSAGSFPEPGELGTGCRRSFPTARTASTFLLDTIKHLQIDLGRGCLLQLIKKFTGRVRRPV